MAEKNSTQLSGSTGSPLSLARKLQFTVYALIILVFAISFLDLIGWIFDLTIFKSISAFWIPMKIVTAISFVFTAMALLLIKTDLPVLYRNILPRVIAITLGLLSLLTLYISFYSLQTGYESSLTEVPYLAYVLAPGQRFALPTAFSFLLISSVLFLITSGKTKIVGVAHILILPVIFISYFILVSYIIKTHPPAETDHYPMALNTAIAMLAVCGAVLLVRTDTWLLKVFVSGDTGSIFARKLLPALIILPLLIGWLRINGERGGMFESNEGVVLVAITYTLIYVILIWLIAKSVNQIDTKRRASVAALHASEKRLKYHFENSPLAVVEWTADFVVTQWSGEAERIFGWKKEEVIGKRIDSLNIIFEEDIPVVNNTIERIKGGKELKVVALNRNYTKRGDVINCIWYNTVLQDENGQMSSVLSLVEDISLLRKTEEALKESELTLWSVLNATKESIYMFDREGRFILANKTGLRRMNILSEDVPFGQHFSEYMLAEIARKRQEKLEMVFNSREPLEFEDERSGIIFHHSLYPVFKGNEVSNVVSYSTDITERTKAEQEVRKAKEKLELALASGNIGVWDWDLTTDEFVFDARMAKMFNMGESSLKSSFNEFEKCIYEDDVPHFRKVIQRSIKDDFPFELIYRINPNNNHISYISTKSSIEKDDNGIPVKMTGVCFDISDMKKGTEQALFNLNEDLHRSNKELEQFAYVASHDLQEPLRMVSSFTQLLAMRYKDKLDNEAQEFIKFAVDGAFRMQSLINDLLEYSRIGTRGEKLALTDINEILGQTINNLSVIINEKSAIITNDELPKVYADGGQMIQLFQNLIGNALKFCNTNPKIHVSAKDETDHYLFTVKDNGIGIEPQYYDRIFQIFQRLHAKDKYGGTGIGLAICRRIVEWHGGKIWAKSDSGEGTVFKFTFKK